MSGVKRGPGQWSEKKQVGGDVGGAVRHLFEAVAMKSDSDCVGCLAIHRYQLSVLKDWRCGCMYDESLSKEDLKDAIPILSFAEGLNSH